MLVMLKYVVLCLFDLLPPSAIREMEIGEILW